MYSSLRMNGLRVPLTIERNGNIDSLWVEILIMIFQPFSKSYHGAGEWIRSSPYRYFAPVRSRPVQNAGGTLIYPCGLIGWYLTCNYGKGNSHKSSGIKWHRKPDKDLAVTSGDAGVSMCAGQNKLASILSSAWPGRRFRSVQPASRRCKTIFL